MKNVLIGILVVGAACVVKFTGRVVALSALV